jgi:hypothetical protein
MFRSNPGKSITNKNTGTSFKLKFNYTTFIKKIGTPQHTGNFHLKNFDCRLLNPVTKNFNIN